MDVISQATLGIGRWTEDQKHPLGFIWHEPAKLGSHGNRTYMYVQFKKVANVDGHQGTPVGLSTDAGEGAFIVHGDESAAVQDFCIGIVCNSQADAVTDGYYGWIQLAVVGEVLHSAVMTSGGSAGEYVFWRSDTAFTRTNSPFSTTAADALGYAPLGLILSPSPSVSASTAPAGGDSLISLYQWAHVYVTRAWGDV